MCSRTLTSLSCIGQVHLPHQIVILQNILCSSISTPLSNIDPCSNKVKLTSPFWFPMQAENHYLLKNYAQIKIDMNRLYNSRMSTYEKVCIFFIAKWGNLQGLERVDSCYTPSCSLTDKPPTPLPPTHILIHPSEQWLHPTQGLANIYFVVNTCQFPMTRKNDFCSEFESPWSFVKTTSDGEK